MKDDLLEECARAAHIAYCRNYLKRKGVPYWTTEDYDLLDEDDKEIDRDMVRAVFQVLES